MAGLDADILEATLDAIREFCERQLTVERQLQLDHEDECPGDMVRAMCGDELGVQLLFIPEEYGGMGGGTFDVYRVCEAMAKIDLGVATSVLATFLGSDPIVVGATPEQKKKWLTQIAEEGTLLAYGATEPEAGSDLGALKTKAVPVEEDGRIVSYKISGRKQWISNGGIADMVTVLANTAGGPTWFYVKSDSPGFTAAKPEDKHGIRLSNTAALFLDDVNVDAEDLIGLVEGQGLAQAQAVFGYTRLMVAAFGLGGGWSALDRAIAYSLERRAAGTPLSEKQGYTHKLLVPHAVRLEAARSFIEETATRIDDGEENLQTEGAIAKYLASESGNAAAEASIQAFGGYGYTKEYLVEKIKRDVRITTIYEGTSEILEMTIARDRWQLHLKTRGEHYRQEAAALAPLAASSPECGADIAALALSSLAEVLESARIGRLTRNQHVLFKLGELIANAETAAAFARRAARALSGTSYEKTDRGFEPAAVAAMSRIFAREAALKVASEGVRLLRGTPGLAPGAPGSIAAGLRLDLIEQAHEGLIDDMDAVRTALYARPTSHR
jgi:alkylation response protein AidB-like acyl-CoA dehydrogenase